MNAGLLDYGRQVNMSRLDSALAILVMAIWGLNFVVVRLGVQEIPPVLFVAMRFAFAFLVMVPFVRWPKGRLRDLVILSFILGTLHFTMVFIGARYLDASALAIVSQLQAVFAAILGWSLFRERLGVVGWSGMAVALVGEVLISGEPVLGAHPWVIVFPIVGYAAMAFYQAHLKQIEPLSPGELNCWVSLLVVPQTLALSWILEADQWEIIQHMTWLGAGALAYQVGPMVVISYWLWYRLLHRNPLTRVAPFQLLMPLFGMIAGAVVLGEQMTWQRIMGGVAAIVGVAMMVLRPQTISVQAHVAKQP
jgi:O-acetylserine/cysteine efflux transporter